MLKNNNSRVQHYISESQLDLNALQKLLYYTSQLFYRRVCFSEIICVCLLPGHWNYHYEVHRDIDAENPSKSLKKPWYKQIIKRLICFNMRSLIICQIWRNALPWACMAAIHAHGRALINTSDQLAVSRFCSSAVCRVALCAQIHPNAASLIWWSFTVQMHNEPKKTASANVDFTIFVGGHLIVFISGISLKKSLFSTGLISVNAVSLATVLHVWISLLFNH